MNRPKREDYMIQYTFSYGAWEEFDNEAYQEALENYTDQLENKYSKLLDDIHDYRYENHCMKLTIRNLCVYFGVKDEEELQQLLFNKGEKKMEEMYCIIQREVNKETGEIDARVCEKGTQKKVAKNLLYYKLRSIFNSELSYFLALQENEKEAIELLGNSIVEESNLYVEIR